MEDLDHLATVTDPLLVCCLCKCLLQEAVQMKCLHNCCQQCFSTAAASKGSSQSVDCGSCGYVTQAGREEPNRFIDSQVQRYKSIAESRVCGKCRENGDHEKPALLWCSACRLSLCGECDAAHRQYNKQHVTQSLKERDSVDDVCSQAPPKVCPIHKKLMDIACLTCEQTKCVSCWSECNEKKHEMRVVGEESFDSYVGKFVTYIVSMESELLRKTEVLEKPNCLLRDTKAARDGQLAELNKRKRCVMDAVEIAYQEMEYSLKCAYDDLETEGDVVAAAAERIASDLSNAQSYIRRLVESNDTCEILNQQKTVRERLSLLLAEVDSLSDRMEATKIEVKMESSLPENFEDIVRAWIGRPLALSSASSSTASLPQLHTQQQQQQQQMQQQEPQMQCLVFGAPSATLQLPDKCSDVALTKGGRSLLLAALEKGLIEFSSSSGHELSRWQPPKRSTGTDDEVVAVAALSDGRAAVCLCYAHIVVLLRRNEKGGGAAGNSWLQWLAGAVTAGSAWTEDRRLDQLPWCPQWLSAHGDVLAVSQLTGPGLQLLSLSSRRRLSEAKLRRGYLIGSLAVTARMVITGSEYKVDLGGGREATHVLDAHSLVGGSDERLWRHLLTSSDEEQLCGVCAHSSGGCLYAAMWRSDQSTGRVSVLSLTDGSELRRVALSFDSAAAHVRLSLRDDRKTAAEQQLSSDSSGGHVVLLAALCSNEIVTVHHSVSDVHQ